MNLHEWRIEYDKYKLREEDLKKEPIEMFQIWFNQAKLDGAEEPNAMSLSTVDPHGMPHSRMLLLKEVRNSSFIFYTNYDSAKGSQLTHNPNAALLFYWEKSQRQVRINGVIKRGDREMAEKYFNTRPINSRISAIASPQSSEVTLDELFTNVEKVLSQNSYICPPNWGAYILEPSRIEFWQGQPGRLHDRILYTLRDGEWKYVRLAP